MMLRATILGLAIAVGGCAVTLSGTDTDCGAADTPEGAVCGFYTQYVDVRPTGLPTPEQQTALAPWLSDSLEARLDAARRVQAQFRADNPGEKPPLVDGCLFASLFEGPTAFSVKAAASEGGVTRVPVQFRYGTEATWQDVVVLVREGSGHVIDDIEFAGAGPFNPPGKLSEALERAGE